MSRLDTLFAGLRGRPAFMPFLPAGDPDIATTPSLLRGLEVAGADLIEVGFPFSDPVADGPVIQAAYTRALSAGVRVRDVFTAVETASLTIPAVGMASYSLIYRIGVERFLIGAKSLSGLIVPDLPLEEAESLSTAAAVHGIDLVLLVTPATPPERAKRIATLSRGFLYCVSTSGVTGARATLPAELSDHLRRLRTLTDRPLCLGFGVSTPEQVVGLRGLADGVIVGSALVRRMQEAGQDNMLSLARQLAAACRGEPTSSGSTV